MERNYQTRNMYEAAFLYAKASSLFIGIEEDGQDVLFVFEGEQGKHLASQYYARTATVNAKALTDAIRTCKDMIFNRLRERDL